MHRRGLYSWALCVIVATSKIVHLTSVDYLFEEAFTIPQDDRVHFCDFKEIRFLSLLEIHGGVQMGTKFSATVEMNEVVIHQSSWMKADVADVLTFRVNGPFSLADGATFSVISKRKFFLIMLNGDKHFTIQGDFTVKARQLNINIERNMINRGKVDLFSMGEGRILLSDIFNLDSIQILAHGIHDEVKFQNLVNQGLFMVSINSKSHNYLTNGCSITNSGLISFHSSGARGNLLQLAEISNDGLMSLRGIVMQQRANITGTGCWWLDVRGALCLNPEFEFGESQSIIFDDSESYLLMMAYPKTDSILNLYGVRNNGHFLRFRKKIRTVNYDVSYGYLSVCDDPDLCATFSIGLGFNPHKFRIDNEKVQYIGEVPPPRPLPLTCVGRFKIAVD